MIAIIKWILCISLLFNIVCAEEVYQSQEEFLSSSFDSTPKTSAIDTLWRFIKTNKKDFRPSL